MTSDLLKLLTNAQRLSKAINNRTDLGLLIRGEHIINDLAEYESWVKDIYDSGEIREFKNVLNFLDDEAKFLKKRGSPKEKILMGHENSLKKAYFKLLYTFKFLLGELQQINGNVAYDGILDENMKLRKLLGWNGGVEVKMNTIDFVIKHRKDFNDLQQSAIVKTDELLENYKEKHGNYPNDVKQLKKFAR
jgi:hypothetical protein